MLSWDDEPTSAQRTPHTTPDAAPAATAAAEMDEGAACYLRPGDDGFEECEACQ